MDAAFIRKAIKAHYGNDRVAPEWLVLFEVRTNSGSSHGVVGGERSIDAVVFNCWRSKGYKQLAFEIKISLADFRNELRDPYKRLRASIYFDEFYFIAPVGIIPKGMVPEGCGLMEVTDQGGINIVLEAMKQEHSPFPSSFMMAILRRAYMQGVEEGLCSRGNHGADKLYHAAYTNLLAVEDAINRGDLLVKPLEIAGVAKRIAEKAENMINKGEELFPDLQMM